MNLLFDIHYSVFGGPHNQALQLNSPFDDVGVHQIVLLPMGGNAAERLSKAGVNVHTAPLARLSRTTSLRKQLDYIRGLGRDIAFIRRLIRSEHIDLVMIAGSYTPHVAVAARLEGVPVVWQILDSLPPPILRRAIAISANLLSDAILVTGFKMIKDYPGLSTLGNRVVSYFPPVDTKNVVSTVETRASSRERLGVPNEAILVGTLGNWNRTKGQQYLFNSVPAILEMNDDVWVRIVGTYTHTHQDYANLLRAEAEELRKRYGDRVALVQSAETGASLLPGMDIFVSSSIPRSEGVPTTILEAMSCGLPVIATNVGGVSDAVRHLKTGLLVEPLDVPELTAAIARLVTKRDQRETLGNAARAVAVREFDTERTLRAHLQAFQQAGLPATWDATETRGIV